MTEKYKILAKYIKDMSSETPNIETYIFVKDYICIKVWKVNGTLRNLIWLKRDFF